MLISAGTNKSMFLLMMRTDAALHPTIRKMGLGFVLRDANGNFVAAKEIPLEGLFLPMEIEAIGVKEAIKWRKVLNFDNVHIESDCLLHFHIGIN